MQAKGAQVRARVVYSVGMHYREGIFRELLNSPDIEWDIIVGQAPEGSAQRTIETIPRMALPQLSWRKTRRFGPLWWQENLIRDGLASQAEILVVDPFYRSLSLWLLVPIRILLRRPTVFWGLGWTRAHAPLKEKLKAKLFNVSDAFMTYGQGSVARAVLNGFPRRKLYAVGNSLQDIAGSGATPRDVRRPGQISIGISGRLTARKSVDLLLLAAQTSSSTNDVQVHIVGDGPQLDALRDLANRLEVQCSFWGPIYDAESLRRFYSQIDVTVIPGDAGLSITQSLMFGRPVITHNQLDRHGSEVEALANSECGMTFPHGDMDGLAHAISAIANLTDLQMAKLQASSRREYEANWTPRAQRLRMEAALHQIVRQHGLRELG